MYNFIDEDIEINVFIKNVDKKAEKIQKSIVKMAFF